MLAVVLGAQSGVSGVLQCHMMFQVNGFHLHGSSPNPASHSFSQTGGAAFLVYMKCEGWYPPVVSASNSSLPIGVSLELS